MMRYEGTGEIFYLIMLSIQNLLRPALLKALAGISHENCRKRQNILRSVADSNSASRMQMKGAYFDEQPGKKYLITLFLGSEREARPGGDNAATPDNEPGARRAPDPSRQKNQKHPSRFYITSE
jgi:hypothetical protein